MADNNGKSGESLDVKGLTETIKSEIESNEEIIGSSKGKDIISFVGLTGAGKSTTINILAGFGMHGDSHKRMVLDEEDGRAMVVGKGSTSVTSHPKGITVGDKLLFDFPGFEDTRGGGKDIVNAALLYNIFREANSNLVVYVISKDQITSSRGQSFKRMLSKTDKWFCANSQSKTEGRCIIFTKSDEDTVEDLKEWLFDEVPECVDDMKPFFDQNRVFQIHCPEKNKPANGSDRDSILPNLVSFGGIPTGNTNIGVTLPDGYSSALTEMFVSEITSELDSFYTDEKDGKTQGSLDECVKSLELVRKKIEEQEKEDFLTDLISKCEKKKEVSLLIPLCTEQWNEAKTVFAKTKEEHIEKLKNTLKAKEEQLVKEIKKHWDELIRKKADEYIEREKGAAGINSSCWSLNSARSKLNDLKRYLDNAYQAKASFVEMVRREAEDFKEKTKVEVFSGSLPDFLNWIWDSFISSLRNAKESTESYIAKKEREEEERRRAEAERKRKEAEERRAEEERKRKEAEETYKKRVAQMTPVTAEEMEGGWSYDQDCCSHSESELKIEYIRHKTVQFMSSFGTGAARFGRGLAAVLSLGLSTVVNGGIKDPTRNVVEIHYKCEECGRTGVITVELQPSNKKFRYGRYGTYEDVIDRDSLSGVYVSEAREIFEDMSSYYSLVDYNSCHFAYDYYRKLYCA